MLSSRESTSVKKVADIANPNIRFVNRNLGSGTRLWFDAELRKLDIPSEKVSGYEKVVKTHTEAASLIETGKADAALGLQAAAHQYRLDFIPLSKNAMTLSCRVSKRRLLSPLLDYFQTSDFPIELTTLTGYNSTHSGEQIPL